VSGDRSVGELAALGGENERDLLGDIDGVIRDTLETPGDQDVPESQLVLVWIALGRERGLEHLAVELVDLVILHVDPQSDTEVAGSKRLHGVTQLRASKVSHREQLRCTAIATGRSARHIGQLLADKVELIGDKDAVVRNLDQREHEPQIARDRRLTRGDNHELRANPPTRAPQTRALISDLPDLGPARSADSVSYRRERHRRPFKPLFKAALQLSELVSERFSHRQMLSPNASATLASSRG
jgi:hypothetical protein